MIRSCCLTKPLCDEGEFLAAAWDLPKGHLSSLHAHAEAQLLYATSGVMRVATSNGAWLLPPQFALWIPAGVEHEAYVQNSVKLHSIYMCPNLARNLFCQCKTLHVTGLLRELVIRMAKVYEQPQTWDPQSHLFNLLRSELQKSSSAPLRLPMPEDPRAKRVAVAILDDPSQSLTLVDWARRTGTSSRTLTRQFIRDTGVPFAVWRRSARLLKSLELLADGLSVTEVAYRVGYESQSAFQVSFQRQFNTTPGRFFSQSRIS